MMLLHGVAAYQDHLAAREISRNDNHGHSEFL